IEIALRAHNQSSLRSGAIDALSWRQNTGDARDGLLVLSPPDFRPSYGFLALTYEQYEDEYDSDSSDSELSDYEEWVSDLTAYREGKAPITSYMLVNAQNGTSEVVFTTEPKIHSLLPG